MWRVGGKLKANGVRCEVCADEMRLEHVLKFKYLDVFWMNQVHMKQSAEGR